MGGGSSVEQPPVNQGTPRTKSVTGAQRVYTGLGKTEPYYGNRGQDGQPNHRTAQVYKPLRQREPDQPSGYDTARSYATTGASMVGCVVNTAVDWWQWILGYFIVKRVYNRCCSSTKPKQRPCQDGRRGRCDDSGCCGSSKPRRRQRGNGKDDQKILLVEKRPTRVPVSVVQERTVSTPSGTITMVWTTIRYLLQPMYLIRMISA